MPSASNIITPANIRLLQTVAEQGSFARAARLLGLVPSALSYRVRQLEETLDLLLFDRSGRQARPTEATMELLREGKRLLEEMESITQRIRRVATGWESHLTIVVENLLDMGVVLELCEAFYALQPPTRIKIREEVMTGTIEALTGGQADLALGVLLDEGYANPHIEHRPLGAIEFVYAVAAHHPLASVDRPLLPEDLMPYRAVVVADSVHRSDGRSVGLLTGQALFTVPDMATKIAAQIRGLGVGYLPDNMVRPHLQEGRLVAKTLVQPSRITHFNSRYAWHRGCQQQGRALQWWLQQIASPVTCQALLFGRMAGQDAGPKPFSVKGSKSRQQLSA